MVRVFQARLPHSWKIAFLLAFAAVLTMRNGPALAITLTTKGGGVVLSGKIIVGDHLLFREYMASANPRFVELDSQGGWTGEAHEIGRIIRARQLPTVVDASKSVCGSACTIIFASGVSRHYLGAEKIQDRVDAPTKPGLGYHHARTLLATGRWAESGRGTGYIIDCYYEFGSGKASTLITKADIRHFYYISAATALELGIATSTRRP